MEKPPQFPGTDKARKWFEQFDQWASRYLGPSGVPLLYVIRKESDIEEDDEGWYQPSLNEDLALRGPHGNESMFWREDNLAVWNMLMHCLHPTTSWTHIKPFQKKADGHGAYTALKANMLGPEVTKTLRANAAKVISTIKYNGQSKGLSFNKMSTTLTQAFLDCGVEYPEDQKVALLLDTINDPSLQALKLAIDADERLSGSYQASINFIKQQIAKRGDTHRGSRNVSAGRSSGRTARGGQGQGGGGRGGGRGGRNGKRRALTKWDPSKPGAFYEYKAYQKFTPEQKALNKAARDKSGISSKSAISKLDSLTSKVAALTSSLETAQAVTQHQAQGGTQSIGAAISGKRKRDE